VSGAGFGLMYDKTPNTVTTIAIIAMKIKSLFFIDGGLYQTGFITVKDYNLLTAVKSHRAIRRDCRFWHSHCSYKTSR